MRILSIVKPPGRLILIRRTAPFRRQLNLITALLAVVVLLLIGYAIAVQTRPDLRIYGIIATAVVVILALKAYDLRGLAEKHDSFCFDQEEDLLMHNGKPVAPLHNIDHILVREVIKDNEAISEPDQYALVVALDDTRRITLAETMGVSEARQDIEEAAREIASFLNVKVEKAARTEDEWWVDR